MERTRLTNRMDRRHEPDGSRDFSALEAVPVGVLVLRDDGRVAFANGTARALFGRSEPTFVLAEHLRASDGRDLRDHLASGDPFDGVIEGSERHVLVSISDRSGALRRERVLSVTDITLLKQTSLRAEFLAHHDLLTGLGNRTGLQSAWDSIEERLSGGTDEVHALALDLDHFKQVNDVHGHAIGDIVLRQVAERLADAVGDAGQTFRFGGDEFFVLIQGVSRTGAIAIAERIVANLSRPMQVQGHDLAIGCSIGLASGPIDGHLRDQLHRAADLALYEVKRNGRGGTVCFDPQLERDLTDQRLLQSDLVLAIANGGFEMVFQPQFDSATNELQGVEAQLQWFNGRLDRSVPSTEFLPVLEQMGLRHLLDLWLTRSAIEGFGSLTAQGWNCPTLSINLGSAMLLRDDTTDAVAQALAEHRLSPERVEIEVSETTALAGGPDLFAAVGRLRALGIHIVVDDFGAGRADLRYLRALGAKRIKLNRQVSARLLDGADAPALVASIWTFCRELGIQMSADGIETAEEWATIARLGRLRGQGKLLGLPEAPFDVMRRTASQMSARTV